MKNIEDLPLLDKERLFSFLGDNALKSAKYKLLYVATPKVACTSLKWWFAELEGYTKELSKITDSAETEPDLIIHDSFYKVAPNVTGLSPEALLEPLTSDDYFRFAVVRNPYNRIFSAWQSKLLLREPLQITPYINYSFYNQPIKNAVDIATAFEGFLEHIAANEAPNFLDVHWTPQVDLLRPDLINYSKLVKIENAKELSNALSEWFGTKFIDPFATRSANESLIPFHPELITARSAELIHLLYSRDFSIFGYSKEIPSAKETFSAEQFRLTIKAIEIIRGRNQRFGEIVGRIVNLNQTVAERDGQIVNLNQAVAERNELIFSLNQTVTERDGQVGNLNHAVVKLDELIFSLNHALAKRDGQIVSLNQTVTELGGQVGNLNHAVAERNGQIARLASERDLILDSTGWKVTKPLRSLSTFLKNPSRYVRSIVSDSARQMWIYLPLSTKNKQIFKRRLFSNLPYLFRWSKAYRSWHAMNGASYATYDLQANQLDQLSSNHKANEYVPLLQALPPKGVPVRLIAFYLPQFHAIAENNEWWGEGFTEWVNVKPAQTQFEGHYQPHLPDELGYYDLLDSTTQHRQIELAKLHGVGGFCFYTYWFAGKLLLEKPVENYLKDRSLDLPFCLCWANENWSRRWDGLDSEILIGQKHSPEDDLAFIQHVSQYMRDERYIRIDGKPLLLLYRPSLLPSAKETAKRWREWCLKNGIGEIYLAYTQSFETVDPSKYGFDAAIEFPPNNSAPPNITETIKPLSESFNGVVYDWRIFVERSRNYKTPTYKLFRSVCPSWDNTARRKNAGTIFLHSSPEGYQEWLTNAVNETCARIANPNERLIFVNAWNEWAEGAHLEPDQRYGYAYLEATRNALVGPSLIGQQSHQIIVVSHDAHPHGAQYLALNMAREFSQRLGFSVDLVCLGGGLLKGQYAQYARLHDLEGLDHRGSEAHTLVRNLAADGHRFAIVNTTVSGFFLETLKAHGIKCISLIHELRGVLDQHNLHEQAETIARLADKVVFAAQQVAEGFQDIAPLSDDRRVIRPQGLYKKNVRVFNRTAAGQELRKALQLPLDAKIILGVGYADYRKGVDLFVEAGKILVERLPSAYLVWLGHWEGGMQTQVEKSLAKDPQMSAHFIFPGRREDTDLFYAGADVYALTSREDPYPSVVLEAMDSSLPVVGFEGAGGCAELLAVGCGKLVPAFNVNAFSSALEEILKSHDLASNMGQAGQALIRERFSFRHYLFDLLRQIDYPLPRVSVVVPNYNYARFLADRIRTIEKQIFPIYELIILDDCSTDDSAQLIKEIIQHSTLDIKFVCNDTNSGSVFAQWQKGVELATGDLVWIAEADDLSEPNFLTDVLRGFDNPGVVLSYSDSKQISFDGKVLCDSYLDYVADISRERWQKAYVCDGHKEIAEALSVKNTIPNVSAVVFKRDILSDVLKRELEQVREFKVAGDWYIYTKLLEHGGIAFIPHSANIHRRHAGSVTNASLNLSQLTEIVRMQRMVANNFLVSNDMQEIARCYAQRLYEQFGLATRKLPNFEQVVLSAENM